MDIKVLGPGCPRCQQTEKLEKLKKAYEGKAAIIFIDVWKNTDEARRFGIRAIPTQIFYGATGREVGRHVGFMREKDIIDQLTRIGVR